MYDSWSTKQRTNSSISRDITLDTVQERRVLRLNLDRWMEGGQVEKGREREREFLLEPHNWTHISTLFISSLRNDGRGLRRSRGTKARHEGDAKRAREREAKVVGVGSGEFPRRTLIACPTFSSREEEDHSKNSSNERLLEKLNLSKSQNLSDHSDYVFILILFHWIRVIKIKIFILALSVPCLCESRRRLRFDAQVGRT